MRNLIELETELYAIYYNPKIKGNDAYTAKRVLFAYLTDEYGNNSSIQLFKFDWTGFALAAATLDSSAGQLTRTGYLFGPLQDGKWQDQARSLGGTP